MGRLFLRMFVGLMLAQFGVRQLIGTPEMEGMLVPVPYVAVGLHEWLVIVVEIICSFFIMIGLCTRIMIVPPLVLMIVSSHAIWSVYSIDGVWPAQLQSIPFLFLGIFVFLLLVGPGKISVDYFLSLYLINRHNKGVEEDLEEV